MGIFEHFYSKNLWKVYSEIYELKVKIAHKKQTSREQSTKRYQEQHYKKLQLSSI